MIKDFQKNPTFEEDLLCATHWPYMQQGQVWLKEETLNHGQKERRGITVESQAPSVLICVECYLNWIEKNVQGDRKARNGCRSKLARCGQAQTGS